MTHRYLTYPSPWPKYVVAAAATLGVLAGLHMFLVGFATWALKMQGPALRHVLSVPYARVVPILARCAPVAAGLPASGTAPSDRERCLQWWRALGWFAETRGQDYFAFTAAVTALLAGVAYSESRKRLRVPASESPATSRWSPEDDLRDFSPRKNPEARAESGALPMGTTVPGYGTRRPVELWLPLEQRFQHIWVLGVTGAGKTSSGFKRWLATDALLDGTDGRPAMSNVVVDVKHPDIIRFLWPVLERRRRRLYLWAPFDSPEHTLRFNFLDYVPEPMDASTAAALILSNTPDYPRRDPFWKGMEKQLLTLLIQMVVEEPKEAFASDALRERARHVLQIEQGDPLPPPKSLPFVLVLAHLSADEFVRMFELWPEPSRTKWRDRFATILSADERTLVGAMLGIQQALSVFAERSVVQATSHSSFRLETLAFQPTTLVIGLPTQPRENRQILTSLFIRQLLDVLGRIGEKRRPQGLPVPVTLYLDEIGTLGYIGNLPEYVATYRDIKVAFVLATQDTEQLTGLFEKEQAETLLANLHTRVVFGYDLRPEQAVRISRDLGEKIILEPTAEYKGGLLSQKRSGARVLVSTRPLLTSDELRNMKPFEAVVVLPGNRKAVTYMKPVHEDPDIPPSLPVQPHWVHLYKRDVELNDVLPTPPRMVSEREPEIRPAVPTQLPSERPELEPVQVTSQPDAPQIVLAHAPEPPTVQQAHGDGAESTPVEQPDRAPAPAQPSRQGQQIDLSEGHLVAFFRALLAGQLQDQRVTDGTPGFVYADKRGEVLVPFGYFMDFGRKTGVQFVELSMRWSAEGLAGPRVSVLRDGKAINCMSFTRQASRLLPPDIRSEIARRFPRVPASAVRVHGQQRAVESQQTARQPAVQTPAGTQRQQVREPAGAEQQEPREDPSDVGVAVLSMPFLRECLELVRQHKDRFEGHPDFRDGGAAPMGRWRHVTRSGEELLLVVRDVLAGHIDALGGRPETVFSLWRAALIIRGEGEDRAVYRVDRTGTVYVAFRWEVLRRTGFPGPLLDAEPGEQPDGDAYPRGA